jgi:UDP-N-acetyl-2-amino-2-deoxyglucuronate dehydrogenase
MSHQEKNLRFAIIGCGRIAQRHAEHISNIGKLVAVCDVVPERVYQLAARYEAVAYTTLDQLLHDNHELDVIAICTPNGLHASQSIQCLVAGYNVICEKPMAISSDDCEAMIDAAARAGKHLFTVKQNRFNPPVVAVKEAIDSGKLGKIFSVQLSCFWNRDKDYYSDSWHGSKDLDGGTLFTQFSHFIDLLYWMVGDVKTVLPLTANFNHQEVIEFEDTGVVAVEFANGALGTINYTVNSFRKNMEGSLTIFGEHGSVKIGGEYLNELEYQNICDYVIPVMPAGNKANNYGGYTGSMSNHDLVYKSVANVLVNGGAIFPAVHESAKTVEIIEKIYAAAYKIN